MGQGPGQVDQRALARPVGNAATGDAKARYRCSTDDRSLAGLEILCRSPSAAKRADQVGLQNFRPEVFGHGVKVIVGNRLTGIRSAGVVDEHIQPAELFGCLLYHGLALGGI